MFIDSCWSKIETMRTDAQIKNDVLEELAW